MRLQQFLSSVFPRLLKTKSERNRQRSTADQKLAVQKDNSHLVLSDLKHAFDTVDPADREGSSALREVTARTDCGQPESVQRRGGGTEDEMDWVSKQYEDRRTDAAMSRSRSMIRTNPWLASPKSTHSEAMLQSGTGSSPGPPSLLPRSLPTTPTTSSVGKAMDYRQALASRRELGYLLLKVPGNLDDSASEGYASSVFRSPSVTDLDSVEGGLDSALASSVSSESDFEWGACAVPSSHSLLHSAASTPGYGMGGLDGRADPKGKNEEVMGGVSPFKTDDHYMETRNNDKEERHSKKLHHTDEVSMKKNKEDVVVKVNSIDIVPPKEHPNKLELVKCYSHSEHSSPDLGPRYSSRNQNKSPNTFEHIKQAEELRPPRSTKASEDNIATREDSKDEKEDKENTELQNMDGNISSRSLNEISESLQDKVRRLHEQKLYVDAVFHRAREADRHREFQFAKFRSQFVAAKRQALLQKLQELEMILGKQSTKLQVVYDAVLLVQWPKVGLFTVCEARSTSKN